MKCLHAFEKRYEIVKIFLNGLKAVDLNPRRPPTYDSHEGRSASRALGDTPHFGTSRGSAHAPNPNG